MSLTPPLTIKFALIGQMAHSVVIGQPLPVREGNISLRSCLTLMLGDMPD